MKKVIWFMMGFSSQRDMIRAIKEDAPDVTVIASHRQERYEILAEADHAYIEPRPISKVENEAEHALPDPLLTFMFGVVQKHKVLVIHTSRNSTWFEENRATIESWGVKLITGASGVGSLTIADSKMTFYERISAMGLPVVPTLLATSLSELEGIWERQPFGPSDFCIKPDHGIYGTGFWHLDTTATLLSADEKRIHPEVYLAATRLDGQRGNAFNSQVVMPFLSGMERSVDIIVDRGTVIAAVGRCKKGEVQSFEISGDAFDLALACARLLCADGLINVQTRDDADGTPYLLEANLRPSGGVCFSLLSGINLAALFAEYALGSLSAEDIQAQVKARFTPAQVKIASTVLPLPYSIQLGASV